MKARKRFHRLISLLLISFMYSLYIGFAAPVITNSQDGEQLSCGIFSFAKENTEDFKLEIIRNRAREDFRNEGETDKRNISLDAYLEWNKKTLSVSGTEAVDLKAFLDGSVSLSISYVLKRDSVVKEEGVTALADIAAEVCDLGNIPFFLSVDEPYWRIVGKSGAWGIGVPGIGIPDEIYKLIPSSISGLLGYNTIKSYEKGKLSGTVSIGSFLNEETSLPSVIYLSNFGLPREINREIVSSGEKYSVLEIVANYYFSVPVLFNQKAGSDYFNTAKALDYTFYKTLPKIQGKITFRNQIKVIHDISFNSY